jgi:hypothetical protein
VRVAAHSRPYTAEVKNAWRYPLSHVSSCTLIHYNRISDFSRGGRSCENVRIILACHGITGSP